MKRMIGILSTVLVTGSLLVPNCNAQAATTQNEAPTQEERFKWDRNDRFDYMVKLQRGQESSRSPIFTIDERRNQVQFKINNESRFSDLAYKIFKIEDSGRGLKRTVVIERGSVDKGATKMFTERLQRGDYYVELECDRGGRYNKPGHNTCEGSAFINILGR